MKAQTSIALKQHSKIMTVTPEQAIEWLACIAPNQRTLKPGRIAMYADDMLAGNWRLTHQGIAFNTKGELIDGQNRLSAICRADTPVRMMVTFDVDEDAMTNIDLGLTRNSADVYRIMGSIISHEAIAIARLMHEDNFHQARSPFEIKAMVEKFQEPIEFVLSRVTGHHAGIKTASVLAAFCRAWYHVPHDRLARALEIVLSGLPDNTKGSHTLIRIRDYLIQNKSLNSGRARVEKFMRMQRCIKAYMDNENLSKIYTPTESCYPLPTS